MTFSPSAEQAAIIRSPLAPSRIAAGAGTGKTTTIARRVVYLIDELSIEPEEILGITFTNKAAQELADRIRTSVAGSLEAGREVAVHTYHGFAAVILREFGALVDIERDTDLVTPAFSRQMLSEICARITYRHFDPTTRGAIEKLRRLGSQLSDNLVSPAEVRPLDTPDEGSPWSERLEMLATLELYDREKRRLGVADFGDLILRAHRLVTDHPAVREAISSRYRAVLLDEYQDTDPGQRELLRTLFSGHTPVTAVGDADQTIYEWRGASKENFERFHDHFPAAGTPGLDFPLSLNRRSGAAILEVANAIRARIDDAERPPLTPVEGTPNGSVVTALLPTAVDEADWIAEQIADVHADGASWSDVAVLFRKNKDMLLVHDALARHGIPFEVANLGGLLTVPEVADLHAWLRVIALPEDSVAAARLLMGSRFRLGLADLAHVNRWIRQRHPDARRAGEHDQVVDYTLLEAIDQIDQITDLSTGAAAALEQFRSEYRHLVQVAQGSALVEVCREVLDHTNAWADVESMPGAPRLSARLNLHRFLDLAEDWSPLEGRPSLTAFLDHLADLELEGSEELDTARLSQADAVTLITVHRAKGLEWPIVFLPAVYERNFPSGSSGYDDPFRFAYSLPVHHRLDDDFSEHDDPESYDRFIRSRHLSQEWRIAYVAATRAKQFLAVSSAWWNGILTVKKRPSEPSELFDLVDALGERVVDTERPPDRPEKMFYRTQSGPAPDPAFEGGAMQLLREALHDPTALDRIADERGRAAYDRSVSEFQQMLFELPEPTVAAEPEPPSTSATGLVTYAQCPQRFFWTTVDPLPRRFSAAARRGTDIHRRIELHNLGAVPLTEPADVADVADADAPTGVGSGGPGPFEVFMESRFASMMPRLTEAPFEISLDRGVRVRGRIDAVYVEHDRWEIVDFKSGRPRTDPGLKVQLETYAVAMDRIHDIGTDPLTVTFAYLGGGRLEETSETADPGWRAEAAAHLDSLAAGIESEMFDPTPGELCGSCDFLRFCPAGKRFLEATT